MTGWITAMLSLAWASLLASPLQHSKRVISLYTVDLNPLFKWWTKHEGLRPLPSWVHITGSIVGTNVVGWIIEGQAESSAPGGESEKASAGPAREPLRIILRSPPVEDMVEFENLRSKLSALTAQRAALAADEGKAKSREQAVAEQQRAARRNGSRSRVLALEDRQLKQAENEAKTQQKPLDQQIQELKSKLAIYPNEDHYAIDCFALDLQRDYERLPVYDYGQVMK